MSSSSLGAINTPPTTSTAPPITPASFSLFTTEYCFTAPAADASSTWLATYTIQETCTGDPATWTPPSIPPDFTTSVITCSACATATPATLVITCPVDSAAQTGLVSIWGDGVTATPTPAPTIYAQPSRSSGSGGSGGGDDVVWWAGPLLTASSKHTIGNHALAPSATYVTADAASVWGSMALLSGAVTFAIGWLLWEM